MIYLILAFIFGAISLIGLFFPTASDEPTHSTPETSVQTPTTAPISSVSAAPTSNVPTVVSSFSPEATKTSVDSIPKTFSNSRLRFTFVYSSGSEAVVECPTLGETVDITQYFIAGVLTTVGCSQTASFADLAVERKADVNGTVIRPTYTSKKQQLIEQNPSMTVEFETDIVVSGVSGKRWKTSAFDLTLVEFDGVLYIFSAKMTESSRQFQFTP